MGAAGAVDCFWRRNEQEFYRMVPWVDAGRKCDLVLVLEFWNFLAACAVLGSDAVFEIECKCNRFTGLRLLSSVHVSSLHGHPLCAVVVGQYKTDVMVVVDASSFSLA